MTRPDKEAAATVEYAPHAVSIDPELESFGNEATWLHRETGLAKAKCWCGWRTGLLLKNDAEQAAQTHRKETR